MTAADVLAAVRAGAVLEGTMQASGWAYQLRPGGCVTRRAAEAAMRAGRRLPDMDVCEGWVGCTMRRRDV